MEVLNLETLVSISKQLRKDILKMVYEAKEGHIPSAYSIVDIILSLYAARIENETKKASEKDIFALSKGHAGAALYAVLAYFKYLSKDELWDYCKTNSILGGHPDRCKVPGVVLSTGSLGHGIASAVGIAYANKLSKKDSRVFVLVGDGEMEEGSYWEAIMLAKDLELDNLSVICDYNRSQLKYSYHHNYVKAMSAHGWSACSVNGHDFKAMSELWKKQNHELQFILAETTKGYGVERMIAEGDNAWHRRTPTQLEYEEILEELSR